MHRLKALLIRFDWNCLYSTSLFVARTLAVIYHFYNLFYDLIKTNGIYHGDKDEATKGFNM